ncbi:MAG: DUF4097 domain-containing protein [Treponema sp.]|jgi:hypothetical protein|nr:DUF4097 domain-containing protein [Treponema sp.]
MVKLRTIGTAAFITCAATAYGNGLPEAVLVNTQQIDLKGVSGVKITYNSDSVKLFRGTDLLVLKEYMSIDDSDYYAHVSYATAADAEKQLVIESGERPVVLNGDFQSRIEVYIPASFTGTVAVKTASGSIRSDDALSFSAIMLESSSGSITANDIKLDTTAIVKATSGSIRVKKIAAEKIQFSTASGSIHCGAADGNIAITTMSGNVDFERVNGNVAAESTSGTIDLKMVTGALKAHTMSGSIRCAVAESAGDIALSAISGSVTLGVPKNLGFRFSAKMMHGNLSTPFSDWLYASVSDRHSITGIIGAAGAEVVLISIDIRTTSGSIRVGWI